MQTCCVIAMGSYLGVLWEMILFWYSIPPVYHLIVTGNSVVLQVLTLAKTIIWSNPVRLVPMVANANLNYVLMGSAVNNSNIR